MTVPLWLWLVCCFGIFGGGFLVGWTVGRIHAAREMLSLLQRDRQ